MERMGFSIGLKSKMHLENVFFSFWNNLGRWNCVKNNMILISLLINLENGSQKEKSQQGKCA
jgi:hypothetical protein